MNSMTKKEMSALLEAFSERVVEKLAEALNGEYVHLKVNSSQVLGSTVREFLK